MSSRLPNQYPTVITRDFTSVTNEDDNERHILELKGSLSNAATTGQEMGILFSARQSQTTVHGNSIASIMVDPTISSGVITGSDLVFYTKADSSDVDSSLTAGLRIKKEGGFQLNDSKNTSNSSPCQKCFKNYSGHVQKDVKNQT